jgi:3-isopropylmalate/(R)-2-methylmalate dehydratase small subunit
VVQGAGIQAVIAQSFSRTYWRNAINNGLLALVMDTRGIEEGAALQIALQGDRAEVRLDQGRRVIQAEPLPEFVLAMRDAGGLVPFLREHGRLM